MKVNTTLIAVLLAATSACAGVARAQAPAAGDAPADGKTIFAKNCAACHQATGKGIPGAFPALAGDAFVKGAPADIATVLLKGRGGMPDFSGSLDDNEIAQVLTYVRASWGNGAAPIAAADVSATRAALGVGAATHGAFSNKH